MYREIFTLYESNEQSRRTRHRLEQIWVLILLLAAIALYQMNLGDLPLRDWDEGIVAQVAREIYRGDFNWLYPTQGGEPYFNKPPLMHLSIAIAYAFGGVNEWTTRLPGAMLTALSVPLLYGVGREVFRLRGPAIFAALIYLTLLPVVRHGRLAMLDGPLLCFFLLTLWCLLRSRRDLRWALGVGIGFGLMCLTKGVIGVLLVAIAAIFIAWDTPRLLTSWYLWNGFFLGSAPVVFWYVAQWLHYGDRFVASHFFAQSFQRLWAPVENNSGPPWYYVLEVLKYAWPWLLFLPQGLRSAWENRTMSWAKLVLVWSGVYFAVISLMGTKLPWYVLPLYPAIALACGAKLAEVWQGEKHSDPFTRSALYPSAWIAILGLLSLGCWLASFYFGLLEPTAGVYLPMMLIAVALTLSVAAFLVDRQDRQFILILFWGMYVSVCLFVSSPHWIWELNEDYPVKPVAEMLRQYTPAGARIYTSHPYHRPSLNFYSDRQVIPGDRSQLQQYWIDDPQPYLLLEQSTFKRLGLNAVNTLTETDDWILVSRQ
ncbi:ArnT family glycosyltransferase [Phormidium sp. CCY1219]|uniref:ArnT family glycosyltransferase n=1 Tax=Phormidium sp. CCY1219 TaxID=2886104 RepID=UPI002D1EAD3E|nr:glycosyltransferase family 39 protein [Phormidium sp. CCY1219]MEB3828497.1 glycosyltransferase family 39 protein [Phormidium sp. CCY1219]